MRYIDFLKKNLGIFSTNLGIALISVPWVKKFRSPTFLLVESQWHLQVCGIRNLEGGQLYGYGGWCRYGFHPTALQKPGFILGSVKIPPFFGAWIFWWLVSGSFFWISYVKIWLLSEVRSYSTCASFFKTGRKKPPPTELTPKWHVAL